MTENNGDRHRTRRRAVRSVGPPAEETASAGVTSVPVERARSAAVTAVADNRTDAVDAAADSVTGVSTADGAAASAGSQPVDLDKAPADAQNDEKPKKRSRRLTTLAAAAALVLALLIAAALSTVVQAHSLDARDARRAEYVQTARQAVLNLTTIRADSAKEDIDRILSLASGQFKNEFDGRVDPFMNIVQQAKVVSNGEIVEAAIESDEEDSAKILVAAKQTLTNAGQEGPQTRFYRFRVTVSDGDSGLTVSKVEFVA
ncbi:hypothetical protein [Nocardia sp. CS682]|uniref:hypothetical protein n=1 Tax=Nocardia sp. CS682 TaxID=1047172 RepID=UPI0010754358|nr:hypothetical protein [Nocardia sp. CS682]QBS42700.1 hypothetical protein DMB37_23920 [Nocardia sp. CS682]